MPLRPQWPYWILFFMVTAAALAAVYGIQFVQAHCKGFM